MENVILVIINALGALGEKGVHWVLNGIEQIVKNSPNLIDNEVFYKVVVYIKSWQPKNPI